MKVGTTSTVDDAVEMIEGYSGLSKSWTYSSNASTKSTSSYCGDSFGNPMEVGHAGINALFQPKGKKGRGKKGKGRGDSGQEEHVKGRGKAQKKRLQELQRQGHR